MIECFCFVGTARVGCNPFPSFINRVFSEGGNVCRGTIRVPSAHRASCARGSNTLAVWQVCHNAKDLDEIVEVLRCVGVYLSSRVTVCERPQCGIQRATRSMPRSKSTATTVASVDFGHRKWAAAGCRVLSVGTVVCW